MTPAEIETTVLTRLTSLTRVEQILTKMAV